ncbi:MAG TPA: hypothetical protein VK043_05755 [Burkholderiales bacterium]|nr:hypothetical protein [Burkholderiales bacterium]
MNVVNVEDALMGVMNELAVLDPSGHSRAAWNPEIPDEVERARRLFESLVRRGYRAFRVSEAGSVPGTVFDPRERETVMVPPIEGG